MSDNLVKLDKASKITTSFHSMISRKASIEFWQPVSMHRKRRIQARIQKVQGAEVFFTTVKRISEYELSDVIYGHIEGSKIVFKSKISFVSDYKLAINLPEYLMILELRENPRDEVNTDEVYASYTKGGTSSGGLRSRRGSARVLNYGARGIALNIKKEQLKQFYVGDMLNIKTTLLNNEKKLGKIIHITPSADNNYTLGIKYIG